MPITSASPRHSESFRHRISQRSGVSVHLIGTQYRRRRPTCGSRSFPAFRGAKRPRRTIKQVYHDRHINFHRASGNRQFQRFVQPKCRLVAKTAVPSAAAPAGAVIRMSGRYSPWYLPRRRQSPFQRPVCWLCRLNAARRLFPCHPVPIWYTFVAK